MEISLKSIKSNAPLRLLNSWKVGGKAEYLAQPDSLEQLTENLRWAKSQDLPVTVLGGGTNVLIRDGGLRGLVVSIRGLNKLVSEKMDGRFHIVADAGCRKAQVFRSFLRENLAPAEFLSGIPGDVGGGVVMNAGVSEQIRPREFFEIVDWVEVLKESSEGDWMVQKIQGQNLKWSYRHCEGWRPGVIVKVGMSWPAEPDPELKNRVHLSTQSRKSRQPLELPSCGSVFVNPPGDKAGRLIEECGLKGKWFGGAQISEKHSNFIVNPGHATAGDIEMAIHHVQSTVFERKGVKLQTEVVFLGETARSK